MQRNLEIYLKLCRKRIRDMKLRTKIRLFLFAATVATVLGIGFYSYHIASQELFKNSRDAVIGMLKQGSVNLDDRISAFQDTSYRILQASNIAQLLDYTAEEAERYRIVNEGLPTAISQQSSLAGYTRYALLRPVSGKVYDYYKYDQKKLSSQEQNQLLDALDEQVSRTSPVNWTAYNGQVYFVRQIITPDLEEKGIICFAIEPEFFDFIDAGVDYLDDEHTIVVSRKGNLLKFHDEAMANSILEDLVQVQDKHYFVYYYTKEAEGDTYTVTTIRTPGNEWQATVYFSHSVLLKGIRRIYLGMLLVVAAVIAIVLLVTSLISRTITRNVLLIEEGMKNYEEGHFEYRISPASYDEVGLLGLQLNHMAVKIDELIHLLQMEDEEKKKKEIEVLQAQINPHFLYNTLGSLKWAAFKAGQKNLADSLDALISLLRFTIKKAGGMVTVAEEIDYIKNYIAIEQMRYGDRFIIEYEIDEEAKDIQIPGFVLQPLVENSFLHGLDMAGDDGCLFISCYLEKGYLLMSVEDNGAGIPPEKLENLLTPDEEQEKKYKGFSSIGLKIVNKRLRELYGPGYSTIVESTVGEGTKITLKIPIGGVAQ